MRTNSRSGNPRKTQNRALTFGSSVATALLLALALGFYGCSEQLPLAPDTSPAQQTQGDENVIEGQYIVVLKSTQQIGQRQAGVFKRTKQDVSRVALNNGVEPLEVYNTVVHGFTVKLTRGQYELLQNDPTVDYIEPDRPVHMTAQTVPWGITEVNAPVAHARGTRGSGVKVGVLDTGIDHGHVDLAANYVSGIDFVNNDNNPMDDNGHGTHVSGTIAAVDNTFGVLGVAPSASLYGIKVLDRFGSGSFGDVIAGIDWSAANGLDVINMSLGASVGTNSLRTACDNAFASGVVICAAAGNDNGAPVNFPAVYSSVIAVSAIDQNLNLAGFSNRGPEVEVTAPGVGVISTFINNQYATGDGTSMSSPHVAGVAALIWSTGQFTTATAVRDQLGATAVDLGSAGRDNDFGFGLVDADAATSGGGGNQAPTANANGPYTGETGAAVSFSSAGSSDPDGTITDYSWDFGDGGSSAAANPTHSYAAAGTYTVTLTVTDDQGATGSNSTTATISDPPNNNPPVADFSGSPTSGDAR
ncbi:MAG: S8 family serine peptidase [Candidatus Zixiibacteriota bacterium]